MATKKIAASKAKKAAEPLAPVSCAIRDAQGREVGTLELDPRVFDAPVSKSLVHQTVRWQRAKARSGNHSCLTKAEVSGGGKKPWRQKGTGRARCGSNTSPLWIGGGVVFGPKPRDYQFALNKRDRRGALISVLSEKRRQGKLVILDNLKLEQGKTREVARLLKSVGVGSDSASIIITGEAGSADEMALRRAVRNLENIHTVEVAGVNVFDLMRRNFVVGTGKSFELLVNRLVAN